MTPTLQTKAPTGATDRRSAAKPPQWTFTAARAIFNDRRYYESNEAMIEAHAELLAKAQRGELSEANNEQ